MTNKERINTAIIFIVLSILDFAILKMITLGVITSLIAIYFLIKAKYNSEQ